MARPVWPVAAFLILAFVLLVGLVACRREESGEPPAQAPEPGQEMELTDAGRERARPQPSPATAITAPLPSLDPRDSAFAARRLEAATLYPLDARIDSLRLSGMSVEDRQAWDAAYGLLLELAAGSGAVSPEARRSVRAELDELAAQISSDGQHSVRLAAPVAGFGEERLFAFRILGPDTDVSGELVLETDGSEWYIADIQGGRWTQPDG